MNIALHIIQQLLVMAANDPAVRAAIGKQIEKLQSAGHDIADEYSEEYELALQAAWEALVRPYEVQLALAEERARMTKVMTP